MSTTVSALLAKARTQLGGYYPGVSPYGQWYGTKVGAYNTYAAAQFCGMFVSWVAGQVGALDIIPLHAYTPSGAAWFKAKDQWHNGKAGARAGDIVYFDFPGAPDRISHVGIVESVNSDGSLNTIEGNTSSVVGGDQRNGRTVARKRRASSIVGYGRPAYASTAAGTTPAPAPAKTAPAPAFDGRALQRAVGATADNVNGPDTRKRVDAVRKASRWGGGKFPYGVAYTQRIVGTAADNVWGKNSAAAHDRKVAEIQRIVGARVDGVWGPDTDAKVRAYLARMRTV